MDIIQYWEIYCYTNVWLSLFLALSFSALLPLPTFLSINYSCDRLNLEKVISDCNNHNLENLQMFQYSKMLKRKAGKMIFILFDQLLKYSQIWRAAPLPRIYCLKVFSKLIKTFKKMLNNFTCFSHFTLFVL